LVEKKLPSGERYRFFYDSTGEKALYPDGTCSVANYDKNGRLLRNRDRREISTFLSYNKADMPVKKIGFGNRTLTIDTLHTHHGPARVTHSEFVESQVEILQEQYEYHWSGAVEKVSQAADSKTRTLESSYDAAGNQVAVKATSAGGWSKELAIDPQYHPGGADTDAFNRVAVLEGATAKVILEGSFLGLPSKTKYGSTPAREVAYGYDLLLRPKSLVSNEGTPELNVQMTRDFVGNLLTRESSNYSYDGLQRMVIGEAESYAYDELSNLSRRGSRSYTYQVAGERDKNQMRLAAYNDGSEHALGYDREGNLVSLEDRFDELVYDNLGRLREIIHDSQTDKYQYDASGIRFRREEGSEIIYSMHSGDWIVFQEKYSSGVLAESRFNLIAGGQILGQVRKVGASDPVYLYFGLDNLGSRRVVWNEDGTVKVKFAYSAWGEFSRVGGAAADEWLASFTGKEYDATGLLYFNARYYDPALGRFLTEDPSRKGTSWYSYCNNNPLTYTDPTGRKYESLASAELTGNQPAAEQRGRELNWRDYAGRQAQQPAYSYGAQGELITNAAANRRPDEGIYFSMPKYGHDPGPCYYGTLQSAAQVIVGKPLTELQKAATLQKLSTGATPAVDVSAGWKVSKPETIIRETIAALDPSLRVKAVYITQNPNEYVKSQAQVTARYIAENTHYNLGDIQGRFIFESMDYYNPANIKTGPADALRYIYVEFE
jgi:RHS repeat-associated protein